MVCFDLILDLTIQCSTCPGEAVWLLRLERDGEARKPGPKTAAAVAAQQEQQQERPPRWTLEHNRWTSGQQQQQQHQQQATAAAAGTAWDPFSEEVDDFGIGIDGDEEHQPWEDDGPPEEEEPEQFGTDVVVETRQFVRAAPRRGWLGKRTGDKPGMCFKLGEQGLGYYQLVKPPTSTVCRGPPLVKAG